MHPPLLGSIKSPLKTSIRGQLWYETTTTWPTNPKCKGKKYIVARENCLTMSQVQNPWLELSIHWIFIGTPSNPITSFANMLQCNPGYPRGLYDPKICAFWCRNFLFRNHRLGPSCQWGFWQCSGNCVRIFIPGSKIFLFRPLVLRTDLRHGIAGRIYYQGMPWRALCWAWEKKVVALIFFSFRPLRHCNASECSYCSLYWWSLNTRASVLMPCHHDVLYFGTSSKLYCVRIVHWKIVYPI